MGIFHFTGGGEAGIPRLTYNYRHSLHSLYLAPQAEEPHPSRKKGSPKVRIGLFGSLFTDKKITSFQDDKYWKRRVKNNLAAKRSREAKREKENQLSMRAQFLEREHRNLA